MGKEDLNSGKFVVSLDFELCWGLRNKRNCGSYRENILGVRKVIPALLKLFDKHDIHATFSTVGFLFAKDKNELLCSVPELKPNYRNPMLSPYTSCIGKIGDTEEEDPLHYAYSLIQLIRNDSKHEIGSHTFSHFYCWEKGQNEQSFRADLIAAKRIANLKGIDVKSLIFPRNQINANYLAVCEDLGFKVFRGAEVTRLIFLSKDSLLRRFIRLIDAYVNISGYNCFYLNPEDQNIPVDISASRFLRPFSPRLSILEPLRLKRILASMEYAAKNNMIYHIWWHPHNFGLNLTENLNFLERILDYRKTLDLKYGFESVNMVELSEVVENLRRKEKEVFLHS